MLLDVPSPPELKVSPCSSDNRVKKGSDKYKLIDGICDGSVSKTPVNMKQHTETLLFVSRESPAAAAQWLHQSTQWASKNVTQILSEPLCLIFSFNVASRQSWSLLTDSLTRGPRMSPLCQLKHLFIICFDTINVSSNISLTYTYTDTFGSPLR